MSRKRHSPEWLRLVAIVALAASFPVRAQLVSKPIQEPEFLRLHVTDVGAGLYSEGRFEEVNINGTTASHDRFFIGPLLGLSADGSLYHPNLFRYVINSEGALGWAEDNITSQGKTVSRSEFEYLGHVGGNADILSTKPLHATLFGDYDHSYRDFDFFNRTTVDSSRYGARIAYDRGPVPMSATYTHLDEEASGFQTSTVSHQDIINFNAHNQRTRGSSALNYSYNDYTRSDAGHLGQGTSQTVTASDNERFGANEQVRLNANSSYTRRDDVERSDELLAAVNLNAEHRNNLSTLYDFTYDNYQANNFDSSSYIGRVELRNQLYDSLTTSLIGQASDYEANDARSTGYTRRYGGGLGEVYTKHIGANHRLRVSNSFLVEQVDQQGIGTVENEHHTFSEGFGSPPGTFFLNLPNVNTATIVVTDESHTQPGWVRGIDYGIQQNGERTLIVRLPGSRIGLTDTVLVDYQATPVGSGQYQAITDTVQVRLDLYKNLWGIYSRVNLFLNDADPNLRVPNIVSYAFGTDISWRWLRSGAEYEIYDSDLSHYTAARLFESASFNLDADSALSIDFSQTWTDYIDAHRQEEDYRFVSRFHQNVTPHLRFDVEGGIDLRRGEGVDQTLATVRPGLDYVIGKTSIKAGYDFEYNLFLDREERTRHLFFLRVKRVF